MQTLKRVFLLFFLMVVEKGSKIKVEYTGRFEDGEVFDSSDRHQKPLEFVAGEGMVVKGFDDAVVGMGEGEEKEFTLKPEDAYGEKNDNAIQIVPKKMMPEGIKEGMAIGVPLENGQTLPAKITKISDESVTIDMNHPLAGKSLIFKIKVLSIE
jgi:FKBP-type peptidyl-prolyl cis-trans isomerase 2